MSQVASESAGAESELSQSKVRCLAMTLPSGLDMLLPNTIVAEVIDFRPLEEMDGLPAWVEGMLSWRGRSVPLVSLERLLSQESGQRDDSQRRYVILNTLNGNRRVPFIATAIMGIPHLVLAGESELQYDDGGDNEPVVLARVRYLDEPVVVPNLDVLEKMLEHLGVSAA